MVNLPTVPKAGMPITADEVARLEQLVARRIPEIENIETLQEWRSGAAALEAYLRSKDLQRPMLGAQRRVEARVGQLLGEPEKGGRRKTHTHADEFQRWGDRTDFRILGKALDNDILDDEEWRKSRRALVSLIRQKLNLLPATPPLPDGIFRCIVADPPWKLDTGPDVFNGTGEKGHDHLAYQQMSIGEIELLSVEEHTADDAHLYLWTPNRYVKTAYDVARSWGFKPSVLLVWAKTPHGVGLGDAYRLTTEFILYARRGSLKERRIIETTWFNWDRGRHSKKPNEFYQLVESVAHPPFLELFARSERDGWTVWGDEV